MGGVPLQNAGGAVGGHQPGALKTRTERLHRFADRAEVEACLGGMAGGETALVRELPRQPGQQDRRWIHLLGPVEAPGAGAGPTPVDRESLLAAGPEARDEKVRAAYAAVAVSYAERFGGELAGPPVESWLLRRVLDLADGGPVIEVGTGPGPGHVAAFLAEAGADATGLDITPEMVDQARRRYPGVSYQVGDLRRLMRPTTHDGWGAALAWYALIHLAASELPAAIVSLARPLGTNGWLVLALHTGAEVRTVTDWFGHEIDLYFVLHEPAEVLAIVERTGLLDIEWYHRGPFTARGETTQRLYILARKPLLISAQPILWRQPYPASTAQALTR
jgi:SAM-dependent methyltransferase